MTYHILAVVLLAAACGPKSIPIEPGKTTKAALVSQKGEPQRVEKPVGAEGPELLVYENDEKFQINREEIVEASFRDPTAEERSLLHWRHKLRACETEFVTAGKATHDQQPLKELRCKSTGLVVIYDPNVDQVVRVVEHAH